MRLRPVMVGVVMAQVLLEKWMGTFGRRGRLANQEREKAGSLRPHGHYNPAGAPRTIDQNP